MRTNLALFLSVSIAGFASAKAPDPVALTPDMLRAVPVVCMASVDTALAFQNDFDAAPAGMGVPADMMFTPAGIVGGALGAALANAMIRHDLFKPRSIRMPRIVAAAGDTNPGELVEASLEARLAALGVASVQRVDVSEPQKLDKALSECAPVDGPFAVAIIRWSLRPELNSLQLATVVSTYESKRQLRRLEPTAEVSFVHESQPITTRAKVEEDVYALVAREHQRYAETDATALIRKVNQAGPAADRQDRQRAARLMAQHRTKLRETTLRQWPRGERLDAVADLWVAGDTPRIALAIAQAPADTLSLFDAWRDGVSVEKAEVGQASRPAQTVAPQYGRFEDINPLRLRREDTEGRVIAPIALPAEGERQVRVFGGRVWTSSWNGLQVDLSRINLTVTDEEWKQASETSEDDAD